MFNFSFVNGVQDLLSFPDACKRHGMLRDMLSRRKDDFSKVSNPKPLLRDVANNVTDAWNEITGLTHPQSHMGSTLRILVPSELIPILRDHSNIPAATFVILISEVLTHEILSLSSPHTWRQDEPTIIKRTIERALVLLEEVRKKAEKLQNGFGFGRGLAWGHAQKIMTDKSDAVKATMFEIATLAGRMYDTMDYVATPKRTNDPDEIDGVKVSDDLTVILPEETASIGIDPEALVRFVEGQSVAYDQSAIVAKNRGPLVIAIDESGSMDGSRDIWAKGCAVALARIAHSENRVVRVVHFSTACKVQDIRTPEDLMTLSETFLDGGTDIEVALEVAIEQVGDLEANGYEGADVVFITDGDALYGEDSFIEMKAKGINLWTVAIALDMKTSNRHLYSYASAYVHIDDQTIANHNGAAVKLAVQLKNAALDNEGRSDV
jgi:hypothetical protein